MALLRQRWRIYNTLCHQITAEELGRPHFWFWIALKLVDSLAEHLGNDARHRRGDWRRNWHFVLAQIAAVKINHNCCHGSLSRLDTAESTACTNLAFRFRVTCAPRLPRQTFVPDTACNQQAIRGIKQSSFSYIIPEVVEDKCLATILGYLHTTKQHYQTAVQGWISDE